MENRAGTEDGGVADGLGSLPHDLLSAVLERVGMPWLLPCEAVSSRMRISCHAQIASITSLDLSVVPRSGHDLGPHFCSIARRPGHLASSCLQPSSASFSVGANSGGSGGGDGGGGGGGGGGIGALSLSDDGGSIVMDDLVMASLFPRAPPCRLHVIDTQLRALTLRCPNLTSICVRSCALHDTMPVSAYPPPREASSHSHHASRDVGWSYNALLYATSLVHLDVSHAAVLFTRGDNGGMGGDGEIGKFGAFIPQSVSSLDASGLVCDAPYDLWRAILDCPGIRRVSMPTVHNATILAKTVILLGGKCVGLEHFSPGIGRCEGQLVSVALQTMALGCPGLRTLDLSVVEGMMHCEALFKTLAAHARCLEGLAVAGQVVEAPAMESLLLMTTLHHLILPKCEGYTDDDLSRVVQTLHLETLCITGRCPRNAGVGAHRIKGLAVEDQESTYQRICEVAETGQLKELYLFPQQTMGMVLPSPRPIPMHRSLGNALSSYCGKLELLYLDLRAGMDEALALVGKYMPQLRVLAAGGVGEKGLEAISRFQMPLEGLMLRHKHHEGRVSEGDAVALTFIYNFGGSPRKDFPEGSGERLIAQLLGDEQAPHDDDEPNGCIMMQNCAALLKRHADSLGMFSSTGSCVGTQSNGRGGPSVMAACLAAMILRGRLKALHTASLPGAALATSRAVMRAITECNGDPSVSGARFSKIVYDDRPLSVGGCRFQTVNGPALMWPSLSSPCCVPDGASELAARGQGSQQSSANGPLLYYSQASQ